MELFNFKKTTENNKGTSEEFNEDSLRELTNITDDLAKKLAVYDKGNLYLDNVKEISDSVAKELVKHVGRAEYDKRAMAFLSLNGLTSISDKLAKILSDYKGGLSLEGLTSISDEAIKHLSKIRRNLVLNGLTEISETASEYLSHHKGVWGGQPLYLNGLKSISEKVALHLGKHEDYLSLNGLISLPDDVAENLSHAEGHLSLNGLKEISEKSAEALSKQKGILYLDGLESISPEAAEYLDQHEGWGRAMQDLFVHKLEEGMSGKDFDLLFKKHAPKLLSFSENKFSVEDGKVTAEELNKEQSQIYNEKAREDLRIRRLKK